MATESTGLELLYASVQHQIKASSDAVICCLHWGMVQNGFKCIGVGEEPPGGSIKRSELLPASWNENQELYSLLYQNSSQETFVLKVISVDGSLLIHVLKVGSDTVADTTVGINEYTTTDLSSFDSAIKNADSLLKKFKKEVLDNLEKKSKKLRIEPSTRNTQQQRDERSREHDPLRVPPRHGQRQPHPDWMEPSGPFDIGRGDLDPLAAGRGGGMLFDPGRFPERPNPSAGLPGRLPPGAVPPGARFDPFGPPGTGPPGSGPDPDVQPPGYSDMFM